MKLNIILLMERIDMADEQALDDALATLSTQVTDLQNAAQAIVDKVSNLPDAPDLSDEIATIQNIGTSVSDATTQIQDAVATEGTPAEGTTGDTGTGDTGGTEPTV